jgi:hypothetical protein
LAEVDAFFVPPVLDLCRFGGDTLMSDKQYLDGENLVGDDLEFQSWLKNFPSVVTSNK